MRLARGERCRCPLDYVRVCGSSIARVFAPCARRAARTREAGRNQRTKLSISEMAASDCWTSLIWQARVASVASGKRLLPSNYKPIRSTRVTANGQITDPASEGRGDKSSGGDTGLGRWWSSRASPPPPSRIVLRDRRHSTPITAVKLACPRREF